ncbi:MAG: GNAT family N-acetyltransferase [Candidatus Saccharibacteria bacterium]
MKISTDKPGGALPPKLFELLQKKYGQHKNFEYFANDYKKAFEFCLDNDNLTFTSLSASSSGSMVGHIALMIDRRRPTGEAFFGFLEVPNDRQLFNSLWAGLLLEAQSRGITSLKGPINGSIWHQYRCINYSDGSADFKSELFTEAYYYDLLTSLSPGHQLDYYSAYSENYDYILKFGKSSYDQTVRAGYVIKQMKPGSKQQLLDLSDISKKVFKNSWGYTELNQSEFLALYSGESLTPGNAKIYLIYKHDAVIGFCGLLREDKTTLICKTLALLPDYHGKGIGNAIVYKLHADAKSDGVTKIIYALIRQGNNIQNFPKGSAVVCRRYAAFEYSL